MSLARTARLAALLLAVTLAVPAALAQPKADPGAAKVEAKPDAKPDAKAVVAPDAKPDAKSDDKAEKPEGGPVAIRVGVYVLNLGKLDISTGSYTVDFYMSLKSDTPMGAPSFEFTNGRAASVDLIEDKPTEKFYRILANLNTPIDLRKFPYDTQELRIVLEDKREAIEKIKYVPNPSETGIDPAIVFPGWVLADWKANSIEHDYPIYGEKYSQYVFSVQIGRIKMNSFLKTFLPVLFMMLIVICSFFLEEDKIITRLATISSGLLAAVMFHVSISNQIPPVSYVTFADKFMMTTYLVLLLCYFLSLAVFVLHGKASPERAKKLHRWGEIIAFVGAPALYLALFLFMV